MSEKSITKRGKRPRPMPEDYRAILDTWDDAMDRVTRHLARAVEMRDNTNGRYHAHPAVNASGPG